MNGLRVPHQRLKASTQRRPRAPETLAPSAPLPPRFNAVKSLILIVVPRTDRRRHGFASRPQPFLTTDSTSVLASRVMVPAERR
jgi:hypothetical protein